MFGDLGKMMNQVKEMKSKMKEVETELKRLTIQGQSDQDWVVCTVDGKLNLKSIKIKADLLSQKESEVEKHIFKAVDQALSQAKTTASSKLSTVTGGLNIPGIT